MTASIVLPPDYKPSADEEYMNDMQLEYFRQKLENWKKSIVSQSVDTFFFILGIYHIIYLLVYLNFVIFY